MSNIYEKAVAGVDLRHRRKTTAEHIKRRLSETKGEMDKSKVTVGDSDITPPKQNRARHSRTWPKKILKSLPFLRLIYS